MDYRHCVAYLPRHGGTRGYSSDGLSRSFARRAPCIANGTPTTHPCACAGVAQGKPSAISPVSFIRSLNESRCRTHPHTGKRHFRRPPRPPVSPFIARQPHPRIHVRGSPERGPSLFLVSKEPPSTGFRSAHSVLSYSEMTLDSSGKKIMRFWWVNHKQTHAQEITGRYLWSPKRNQNGNRNQSYDNMREALPGDIVFSYVKRIAELTPWAN